MRMSLAGGWMGAWNVCAHLEQLQVRTFMVQVEATSPRIPSSVLHREPQAATSPALPLQWKFPFQVLAQLAQMSCGTVRCLDSHPMRGSACAE